jgi:hypothetical protein
MRSLGQLIKAAKGARNVAAQLIGTLPHPTVEYLYVELLRTPQGRLTIGRVVDHTGAVVERSLSGAQREELQRQIALQQQFLQREAFAQIGAWNGAGSFARERRTGTLEGWRFTWGGYQVTTIGGQQYVTLWDAREPPDGVDHWRDAIGRDVEFEVDEPPEGWVHPYARILRVL